ncbi:MAG: glycoside hydrolase family 15 protein [Gemmatimonadota bacterium]|nr:glycoside hydrolase family 15 protein [Gemmatimonadota bacterium]
MPQPSSSTPPAIGDYGIIGDCRSAALISRHGSIDWLCWPQFDSPSIFAALLDRDRGGFFAIRPTAPASVTRRYLPATNVLETTFRTDTGVLRLVDCMPVASREQQRGTLRPQHEVLRRIECVEGEADVEVICDPRPDYARVRPRLRRRGALGVWYEHDGMALVLRSDLRVRLSDDHADLAVRARMRAGDRHYVSLVSAFGEPAVLPPLGLHAEQRILQTVAWWEAWSAQCTYAGRYPDAVLRSALTLKLMVFAPSGAVVAAPTTSLPEAMGGERNWDYRYCWLRDSSLTLQALFDLGYHGEGESFMSWLVHTTRASLPRVQVLYDVYGEPHLPERTLGHLAGFNGSRPVRVGNGAHGQLQLDIYGEVIDAARAFTVRGGHLNRGTRRMLAAFGDAVCDLWSQPDEGIWEPRAGRRHNTYSKSMCWVALDRLCRMHDEGHLSVPTARYRRVMDEIRRAIETRGFNDALGSYTDAFDGADVDASLLLLPRYGYADAGSPRMRGTYARVAARLGANGLLYRYHADDGLAGEEGAFGICSFWAVSYLAQVGDLKRADAAFQHLLTFANDLGLFAEEIDPATGAALGNFPQAFTHVGLIDAALQLAHERGVHARPDESSPAELTTATV